MAGRVAVQPPRRLLVLFVGITLALATTLVWLGWRLVRQDRDLERERVREHLESAADVAVAAIERRFSDAERALAGLAAQVPAARDVGLASWSRQLGPGAVLVDVRADGVEAFPSGQLVYYPDVQHSDDGLAPVFATGERLEFQDLDLTGAAAAYRTLARSSNQKIRAGAMLRLGRAQRKGALLREALETYARLESSGEFEIDGLPTVLVARHARLTILPLLGRSREAGAQAESLYADIRAGRWRLSRGSFEFYVEEARRRLPAPNPAAVHSATGAVVLAEALDSLWREWNVAPPRESGRRVLAVAAGPVLVLWKSEPDHRVMLLLSPQGIAASWLADVEPALAREGVRLALSDAAGRTIVSQFSETMTPVLTRTAAETGLPWTIRVASRDLSGLTADLASRRRMLLAGLLMASLLGIVGTYAVVRAVGRELDVARVQSDFVAAVSHEFRTPLTSLRQLTELLASNRVPDEDRRRAYYDVLRRETARLQRLVEGLLDFGRMEVGAHEFRLAPVDATQLVREVSAEFQQERADDHNRIAVDAGAEACVVRADREALARAYWNLLDNAAKYASGQPIVVSVARQNGRVTIAVGDSGPGIPAHEQQAVFEKFVRGSQARSSGIRGTGLGLAMVRQIVRAHGGAVRVVSEPGRGSTFTLDLPAEPS